MFLQDDLKWNEFVHKQIGGNKMNVPQELVTMVDCCLFAKNGVEIDLDWSFYDRDLIYKKVLIERNISKDKIKVGMYVYGDCRNEWIVTTKEDLLDKLREIFSNVKEMGDGDVGKPN